MPAPPPGRKKPGTTPSKHDRDTSKKNVALSKAQQKQEMARKVVAKKLITQQKDWEKQRDAAVKVKKVIDEMMKTIKEDQTLDQRFLGLIKKFGAEMVKLEKQVSTFGKAAETPKMFAEVQVAARKVPAAPTVQTYASMSMFLAVLIVVLNRALKLRVQDTSRK